MKWPVSMNWLPKEAMGHSHNPTFILFAYL